jgi:hypothetical protein
VVNLYNAGTASLKLHDQTLVSLKTDTLYPGENHVTITVQPAAETSCSIKLRIPAWCQTSTVAVNGKKLATHRETDGYVHIERTWKKGDRIDLTLKMEPKVIVGDHKNEGKIAVLYGPLVLAADSALLGAPGPNGPAPPLGAVAAAGPDLAALNVVPEPAPANIKSWPGAQVFRINAVARRPVDSLQAGSPVSVRLIPFSDAGGTGTDYKVWLPLRGTTSAGNLLVEGKETRSRRGNMDGSINDDDLHSTVVTYDGKPATEDWFAVILDQPVAMGRIVFAHGMKFHDGGWFDTSSTKPQVQVLLTTNGAWKTVGELDSYPATTATNSGGLRVGDSFTCRLKEPVRACGVRVIGKPACGDNPQQAFSSCAELQAFSH